MGLFLAMAGVVVAKGLPVEAAHLRDDIYRIVGQPITGERWEFSSGEVVRCREQTFADGQTGLVG